MLLWHGGQVGARFRRARLPGVNSPSPLTIPGSIEKLDRPIQPVRQSSSRVLGSEVLYPVSPPPGQQEDGYPRPEAPSLRVNEEKRPILRQSEGGAPVDGNIDDTLTPEVFDDLHMARDLPASGFDQLHKVWPDALV